MENENLGNGTTVIIPEENGNGGNLNSEDISLPTETNEEEQENKPFSVDDLDFGEDTYKVGGYDFSKYKEAIEESELYKLEDTIKKYYEKGFTQEQMEFLIENDFIDHEDKHLRTPEEIKQELAENLTMEEKRNYKTVGTELKEILEKNNLGKFYEEAMSNPIVYKLINAVMQSQRKGGEIKARVGYNTAKSKLTVDRAIEQFNEFLSANLGMGADIPGKQKELMAQLDETEREIFKQTLGI